jgi:hypothetical protein
VTLPCRDCRRLAADYCTFKFKLKARDKLKFNSSRGRWNEHLFFIQLNIHGRSIDRKDFERLETMGVHLPKPSQPQDRDSEQSLLRVFPGTCPKLKGARMRFHSANTAKARSCRQGRRHQRTHGIMPGHVGMSGTVGWASPHNPKIQGSSQVLGQPRCPRSDIKGGGGRVLL